MTISPTHQQLRLALAVETVRMLHRAMEQFNLQSLREARQAEAFLALADSEWSDQS